MLDIHYAHPTAILDFLDVDLVLPKGKLLAQPFGPDAKNPDKHAQLKALLFATIIEITDSQDVSVCAPKAKANQNQTPFSFFIYNLSEQQICTLLEKHVWSSTAITFSISTLNPGCPKYMFSIKGLMTMNNKEVYNTVNEVWHEPSSLVFL